MSESKERLVDSDSNASPQGAFWLDAVLLAAIILLLGWDILVYFLIP